MVRLKARRGAVVVIVGVMIVALMAITALSLDFSRMWSLRNELQTSADAAALAGAIQLISPRVTTAAMDSARVYAKRNRAMQDTVTIDSMTVGDWDDSLSTYIAGVNPPDAISVVLSRQSTGLLMAMLGVPLPRIRARAIGWAEAPVATVGCIKPWALPYVGLMAALNNARGLPNTYANLTRPFDQVADLAALQTMTTAQRTFTLKLGSGTINDSLATATNLPGNYQAVQMPKYWDKATGTYPSPGPINGANEYRNLVAGSTCHGLSVGDSLLTQPGNMVGPTLQGAQVQGTPPAGICHTIVNSPSNLATHGNCLDANGNVGVEVKSAFYLCATGCNGQTAVGVALLGSFTLTKVYPTSQGGQNPQYDRAQIEGIYSPSQDVGPVGGGSTTIRRPILVK